MEEDREKAKESKSHQKKETQPPAEPEKDAASGKSSSEPSAESEQAEEDKFIEVTRKVTSGAEKAIGNSYKKIKTAASSAKFDPRKSVAAIDRLLDWARNIFPPERYEAVARWSARYGHAGLVAAQVLAMLFYIAAAIKFSSWSLILIGIGVTLLLVALQYTADKFLHAGESMIKASPSRLGSPAFLDCLAVLTEILGVGLFIFCILQIRPRGWSFLFIGIGLALLCDAVAYIALNPSMANTSFGKKIRAGEEAIGIMSFLMKAVVRLVPLAFGVGAIVGTLGLLFAFFPLLHSGQFAAGAVALRLIIMGACLPLASYVVFAFYHLLVDLMRSILVLPEKLDK
ncbi:MAG: hypothetical protein R6V03_08130 [Kiritimatiellia bacterium]